MPTPAGPFYSTVLGAVLAGLGLALVMQQLLDRRIESRGIEIPIVVNFAGAGGLIGVLVAGHLDIPIHGLIFLWIVAAIVLAIGVAEIVLHFSQIQERRQRSSGPLVTSEQEGKPAG